MDIVTVGRYLICFGDNLNQRNLGIACVFILFGTILFYIMPFNILFLLCLKDMDQFGIFFNNVENVLTYKKKNYFIV